LNSEGPPRKIAGLGKNVFFAGLVSLFMDLSSEMIYPLVPIFLSSVLGVNKSVIGLIEGVAESTASLLRVFSGWFSDRTGKRKIWLLAGYGISTLSRPILALSSLWVHVLAFRFVDRFGKGIRGAPRDAIIAESAPVRNLGRSFGYHRAMDTLGAVIGPAAAFFILLVSGGSYRLVFWLSMVPGTIALLVILFFISEKKKAAHDSSPPRLSFGAFDRRYKIFLMIVSLFALGNSSDVFLILKATNSGIGETRVPLLYLFFNAVYALTSLPAGILSDRIGKRKIIIAGFILFGFIYWGFAVASLPSEIWALFFFYGIFMGLTEGVQKAYLGTIVPEKLRATGYGLYNTFVGMAVFPASLLAGILWDRVGPHATFYYGAFTAFVSAGLFLLFFRTDQTSGAIQKG
jgi:MFS family permease